MSRTFGCCDAEDEGRILKNASRKAGLVLARTVAAESRFSRDVVQMGMDCLRGGVMGTGRKM